MAIVVICEHLCCVCAGQGCHHVFLFFVFCFFFFFHSIETSVQETLGRCACRRGALGEEDEEEEEKEEKWGRHLSVLRG